MVSLHILTWFVLLFSSGKPQATVKNTVTNCGCHRQEALHQQLLLLQVELQRAKETLKEYVDIEVHQMRTTLNTEVAQIESKISALVTGKPTSSPVAFSAYGLSQASGVLLKHSGEKLIYTNIALNEGSHYNRTTGDFTCPITGVYFFAYTVYGYGIEDHPADSRVSGILVKENEELSRAYFAHYNSENMYITVSNAVLTECSVGQRVWVEAEGDNNEYFTGLRRNVFSGFLVSSKA